MGVIVKVEDFEEGKNQVMSGEQAQLEAFIDAYEKPYLSRILGIELAELMLSDAGIIAGNPPVDLNLLAIYNPLVIKYRQKVRSSIGMLEILKGFIAAEYIKDLQQVQTTSGLSVTLGKNSKKLMSAKFVGYNETIIQARAVQIYCRVNSENYTAFAGEELDTIDPLW